MPNIISIYGSSQEEIKTLVTQFLGNTNQFTDALYSTHSETGMPQVFPLVISGTLKEIPCTLRIANINFHTVSSILCEFGFTEKDVISIEGSHPNSKFYHKH